MAKRLTFSNGQLQVNLGPHGLVEGLYFPYIGLEDHVPGLTHRIGVWVDGRISWLNGDDWTHRARLSHAGPVGHTVMVNDSLGVLLEFEDFVQAESSAFIRNIHIVNIKPYQRQVRLFLHQAFDIGSNLLPDTAQYLPEQSAVLHYGGRRAFVAGGATDVGQPLDQHTVGLFGSGRDGTWRDAEDGELHLSDVESGRTDSTIRFSLTIGGLSSRRVYYWLAVGESIDQAISLASGIKSQGVYRRLDMSLRWWKKWLHSGVKAAERLPSRYHQGFNGSLLKVKSMIDQSGALLSADDDGQLLCLPHVASYATWPLMRLGYRDEALRFFEFIRQVMTDDGYLLSNYLADGAVGPTKLPYLDRYAPIQSSQTALVLFVFSQFHALNRQSKLLTDYYSAMVEPMANFLSNFTDESGLPQPSYDPSSKSLELNSYTAAITHGALVSAAELADKMKDADSAVRWRSAAEDMHRSAMDVFAKGAIIYRTKDDTRPTIASLYGAFMFGLMDIDDHRLTETARRLEESLLREDGLFSDSVNLDRLDCVGSLWMAQYYMEAGKGAKAEKIITQILEHLRSCDESSSAHDTWVHAEVLNTLLDTMTRT